MRYHNGKLIGLRVEDTPFLRFGCKTQVARACDKWLKDHGLEADPFNGYDKVNARAIIPETRNNDRRLQST